MMFCFTKVCVLLVLLGSGGLAFQNPARKTWWAQRVLNDNYYTAGRLSARQMKYAIEDGFKSLISVFSYDSALVVAGVSLPSSQQATDIAELSGGVYTTLDVKPGDNWKTQATLDAAKTALEGANVPILLYDDTGYIATFLVLVSLARKEEDVTGLDVFRFGALIGYDYGSDPELIKLVSSVMNDPSVSSTNIVSPNPILKDVPAEWYKHYWPAKFMADGWFMSGMLQSYERSLMIDAGFKTLMNLRKGNAHNGQGTQEEVVLLNIIDKTGTYTGDGRQSVTELEKNILDPTKSNAYISPNSTVNYESRNPLEYGDDIGYNEEMERKDIPKALTYVHVPIGNRYSYSTEMWDAYKASFQQAEARGPVLVHCRTGFRSAAVAILQVAQSHKKNSTWAVERLEQMGYDMKTKAPTAVTLYEEVLDKDDAGGGGGGGSVCNVVLCVVASALCLLLS